ncbi:MAG: hypothetical protein AAGK04_11675, partial [Planctomycetota bacterium]
RDVRWVGQRLTGGTCGLSGTTLTASTLEVAFDAAGVDAGAVVLLDEAPYEVVSRTSGVVLEVSRLRGSLSDASIPGLPVSSGAMSVATFEPQISMVARQVLRLAGIDSQDASSSPGASDVVNGDELRRVVALGALHLIFAAAGAPGGSSDGAASTWSARAAWYRERFSSERARVSVLLDLDGNGEVDAARRLDVGRLVRG